MNTCELSADKRLRQAHGVRLLAVAALALMLGACAHQDGMMQDDKGGYSRGSEPAQGSGPLVSADAAEEKWGIRILGVRTTAEGYMLDFRYRVLDAEKAAPLLDRRIKPYLVVEKSQVRMAVPVSAKIGAMRQTTRNVKPDRNYFVMFGNPGRHVQPGDRVNIVIGEFATGQIVVM